MSELISELFHFEQHESNCTKLQGSDTIEFFRNRNVICARGKRAAVCARCAASKGVQMIKILSIGNTKAKKKNKKPIRRRYAS